MTTNTAARAASTFPLYKGDGAGALCVAHGTFTLAANPSANDIIEFCRVPAGATVVGGWMMADVIDTGAGSSTLDIDIGWEANGDEVASTAGFGDFGVLNGAAVTNQIVAGNFRMLQGVLLTAGPKTFNAETVISGKVIATADATGTGAITVVVLYHTK